MNGEMNAKKAEDVIWNPLIHAGVMGNLQMESALESNRVEGVMGGRV